MSPSELNRRVVLQEQVDLEDDLGQRVRAWTDYLAGIDIEAAKTITGAVSGETTRFTLPSHGYSQGDLVRIAGVGGITGLPCTFGVLSPSADEFSIDLGSAGIVLTTAGATATRVSGVPASIQPANARELIAAAAQNAEAVQRVVVRYHPLLADPLKVAELRAVHVHGALTRRLYLKPAMNIDFGNRWIVMTASEGLRSSQ